VLVSRKDQLDTGDFESQLEASPGRQGNILLPGVGIMTLEEMEVLMIKRAMEFHRNRVGKAAISLGLTRSSLYRRLDKYNIPYDEAAD
jgi:transcriptional regulator with PAS, ATPase and Fis domain